MKGFAKPPEGSWTEHYPELGTGRVSFDDSVSPDFFALEREAIFRRAWLNVGRLDDLPRTGSWFTKDLVAARTSLLVTRDRDGVVRAFHNVCRHRGNKLVWIRSPREEASGVGRQFACKYHGWRYGLDGGCTYVHQEREFFDLDRAELGLAPVHCEVWAGFVFVNLADEPGQSLREYLGPMVGALEGYPFDRMTERYSFRAENRSNWKVFIDAFQEYYHVPPLHTHQLGPVHRNPEAEFEGAHYQLDGPHRVVSTSGSHKQDWAADHLYPSESLFRSGNTGPWDAPDLGPDLPGVNPGGVERWGIDNFQVFPNLEILVYERNWYLTYRFWPTSHNTHVFEADLWFTPATSTRERLAREYAAVTVKEYALQDAGTLDGTQLGLESRAFPDYPLNDQEILVRHFHRTVGDWVAAYQRERGGGTGLTGALLPSEFADLEAFASTWCLATEPERWARRQSSTMDQMEAFYDACFPRAEDAIAYCDQFDLAAMPEDATRLLQLLHSLALVSYAVEVWRQPLPVDTGAAAIDRTAEPQP